MNKTKEAIIKDLTKLNYFKYVAKENLETVINESFSKFQEQGIISFPWDGLNRLIGIGGKTAFKGEGLKSHIEAHLLVFQNLGIDLEIGDYVEEFDEENSIYTKRTIELNDEIYDGSGVTDWATAFNSIFKIIDQILEDYGKEDRLFGLFMDESSSMIILDEPQFEYLSELIPEGAEFRPIDIKKMIAEHFPE